ncbi:MAG: tetratricopeptide repeat protein [Ignavibacteriae bacterium]|nr:tetratricopeptide repeat protein [Ignavibacteriota bacterium]
MEINDLFTNALELYRSKNFKDSFDICNLILNNVPNHSETLHLYGLLYIKASDYDSAVKHLRKVTNLHPENAQYQHSLGLALMKDKKIKEAKTNLLKAVDLEPELIQSHLTLAKIYKIENKLDHAENEYRTVLKIQAESITALINLGNLLQQRGEQKSAFSFYKKVLDINPDHEIAHLNLANVHEQQGENSLALEHYQIAIKINPKFALAFYNLGKLHFKLENNRAAIESLQRASKLEPGKADYLVQLATVFYKDGDFNTTKQICSKALQIDPNVRDADFYLGIVMHQKGYIDQALEFFLEELKKSPLSDIVHFSAGKAYLDLKNYDKASYHFNKSNEIDPDDPRASFELIQIRLELCDWSRRGEDEALFIKLLEKQIADNNQSSSILILTLNYFPLPLDIHLNSAKYYAKKCSKRVVSLKENIKFTYKRDEHSKLRIGYISPDFRQHAVGSLIKDLFKHHDKSNYEIFGYSLLSEIPNDQIQRSIKEGCNHFVNLYDYSVEKAAKKIYEDQIDILVDLAGYTAYSRTDILALKPAPIQVLYLGYPNTMGADFIDYMMADSTIITDNLANSYTEKIVYLPQTLPYSPMEISDEPITREYFGLPEESIVFCCFNSFNKLDPDTFDIWMNILKKVPNSVLWLSSGTEIIIDNLKKEAENRGIKQERIKFKKKLTHAKYMAIHQLADLFLDTFLYNAGSTAVCSIAAGLPILTCPGLTYSSRMSASILTSAGLPELICSSKNDYVDKAVFYAKNPEELANLKEKMGRIQNNSNLFNLENFVNKLETAYSRMWENYLNGKRPVPLEIAP